mgnify:CR=1 FL=1
MQAGAMGSIASSTKLMLVGLAATAMWLGGKHVASSSAAEQEGLGRVVWAGDASYDTGTPGVGMRAKTTRRVPQAGVHVLLDGRSEPLEFSERSGSRLQRLAAGDRVRISYREGGFLFWHELRLLRIEKLAGTEARTQ